MGLAFGESVFLRKLLMPILVGGYFDSHRLKHIQLNNLLNIQVPLKLWIALQLVLMLNPVKDAGEEESKLK